MKTCRITAMVFCVLVALGASLIIFRIAFAGEYYLIAIPPFKGKTGYPPLHYGLQQILFDDLNIGLENQIMEIGKMTSFLKGIGKGAGEGISILEIKKYSNRLKSKFILYNDLIENEGIVKWEVKLLNGLTGSVEKKWGFQGELEAVMGIKNQVVLAILQYLAIEEKGEIRKKQWLPKGTLSSLMAFSQGVEAFDDKDYQRAIACFREALNLDSDFFYAERQLTLLRKRMKEEVTSARELGLILLADEKFEESKAYLKEALSRDSNDREVLIGLNRIDRKVGDYDSARQKALKARDIEPNDPIPWIELGKASQAQGKADEAIEMFEKAKALDPYNPEIHQELALLYEMISDKERAKEGYTKSARIYSKELRVEEAQRNFSRAKNMAADDAGVLIEEGDFLMRIGQDQKALKIYEEAKKLDPTDDEIYQKIGKIYHRTGENKGTKEYYQKALSLNPENFEANLQMGNLSRQEKRFDEAIVYLEKARGINPDDIAAGKALGRVYFESGKDKAALNEYRSLSAKFFYDPQIYKSYGDILLNEGDLTGAMIQYEKAIGLDPDYSSAYESLGKVQKRIGNNEGAKIAFDQAKLLDPNVIVPEMEIAYKEGLKEGLIILVEFLPSVKIEGRVSKVAPIEIGVLIDKKGKIKRTLDYLKIRRLNIDMVREEVRIAFKQRYDLLPQKKVNEIFAAVPYNSMKSQDITDSSYLSTLCRVLDADALIFYKIGNEGEFEDGYHFTIDALLYRKAENDHYVNKVIVSYTKEEIESFNTPLIAGLFILVLLIGVYYYRYNKIGFGDLKVVIEKDPGNKAYFFIVVSKKANKDLAKTKTKLLKGVGRMKEKRYVRRIEYTKYEESMISKDTIFKRLHADEYYVYLYGIIQDVNGNQIGNYQMTQKTKIEKDKTKDLLFDLHASTSYVEIHVLSEDKLAKGAEVSINGKGNSKYIKDENGVFFRLPIGTYTLLINYKGLRFKEKIEIPNLEKNFSFTINLPNDLPQDL